MVMKLSNGNIITPVKGLTYVDKPFKTMPKVSEIVKEARLVAYDDCHKIYLAMDDDQAKWFKKHYPNVVSGTPDEMLDALGRWWKEACPSRFITAVYTRDTKDDFVEVVAQGDVWPDSV